eukprot:840669-Prorocentrum_minimum.AAC.1
MKRSFHYVFVRGERAAGGARGWRQRSELGGPDPAAPRGVQGAHGGGAHAGGAGRLRPLRHHRRPHPAALRRPRGAPRDGVRALPGAPPSRPLAGDRGVGRGAGGRRVCGGQLRPGRALLRRDERPHGAGPRAGAHGRRRARQGQGGLHPAARGGLQGAPRMRKYSLPLGGSRGGLEEV